MVSNTTEMADRIAAKNAMPENAEDESYRFDPVLTAISMQYLQAEKEKRIKALEDIDLAEHGYLWLDQDAHE